MEETQPTPHAGTPTSKYTDRERMLGAIAYLGPLFIVSYLMAENSKFIKFHAGQGLVFFLAALAIRYGLGAIMMALFIPSAVLSGTTGPGMMYGSVGIVGFIMMLISLAILVVGIIAIVKAVQGEEWEMPVIGQWAKKIQL